MVSFMVKNLRSYGTERKILMARHGENIRKRKDGRWEGRYPVYSEKKERRVYCSVYGRTYDEVREKLTIKKNLVKGHPETVERADSQKIHIDLSPPV